jgi:hypothetical protein
MVARQLAVTFDLHPCTGDARSAGFHGGGGLVALAQGVLSAAGFFGFLFLLALVLCQPPCFLPLLSFQGQGQEVVAGAVMAGNTAAGGSSWLLVVVFRLATTTITTTTTTTISSSSLLLDTVSTQGRACPHLGGGTDATIFFFFCCCY